MLSKSQVWFLLVSIVVLSASTIGGCLRIKEKEMQSIFLRDQFYDNRVKRLNEEMEKMIDLQSKVMENVKSPNSNNN